MNNIDRFVHRWAEMRLCLIKQNLLPNLKPLYHKNQVMDLGTWLIIKDILRREVKKQ